MAGRFLLDTSALLLWALDPARLSPAASDAIADGGNELFVSSVSAMEISTKVRIGKLDLARPLATGFKRQMIEHRFLELVVTMDHAELAGSFPSSHNDPWDRLLAAQARLEGMTLISNDEQMKTFGITPLW